MLTSASPSGTPIPCGRLPMWSRPATWLVGGSTRTSVPSYALLTHTPLASAAMAVGPFPTGNDVGDRAGLGIDSRERAVQAVRHPGARVAVGDARRPVADLDRLYVAASSGSMRATRLSRPLAGPERAGAEGELVAATVSGASAGRQLSGSILVIVPSPVFATQIDPLA